MADKADMKIVDLVSQMWKRKEKFLSLEFFPSHSSAGRENLVMRIKAMIRLSRPLFINITWTTVVQSAAAMDLLKTAKAACSVPIMMHLTCIELTKESARKVLSLFKELGVRNILVLRGHIVDTQKSQNWTPPADGFQYAAQLVAFIRAEYKDYFCIAVGGYVEQLPDRHVDRATDLAHLQAKVHAGADLVLTQFFFDTDAFKPFVTSCRALGITCPIIPGVLPIHNYDNFMRITKACGVPVPKPLSEQMETMHKNGGDIKQFGVHCGRQHCDKLLADGAAGIHFFTLNLTKTIVDMLKKMKRSLSTAHFRVLPWDQTSFRENEDVRPIYWANRPKSYVKRTDSWSQFPCGRWNQHKTEQFSPSSDIAIAPRGHSNMSKEDRRAILGENPISLQDIYEVFAKFLEGEVSYLPWCETKLDPETACIAPTLVQLNRKGCMTVNSQPRVCGRPSTDPDFGWGKPGGRVYQKAYIEFFCSPEMLASVLKNCEKIQSVRYIASDVEGNLYSNCKPGESTAVTWGVFPNSEVLQPTVVNDTSFMAWKDEAFALWLRAWGSIYEDDDEGALLIEKIHDTFFLVSIVDNDFVSGDIFKVFSSILSEDGPGVDSLRDEVDGFHYLGALD